MDRDRDRDWDWDRDFPSVLFPSFYNSSPPDTALGHCAGSWGSYGRLRPDSLQTPSSSHCFKAQHEASGEVWCHTEPVPVPLFSPKHAVLGPWKPADPLDFSEHLENFFVDFPSDAFSSTAGLLGDSMYFGRQKKAPKPLESINMRKKSLKYSSTCPWTRSSRRMDAYSCLLSDAVHSVPVELLAPLLHEELHLQSLEAMFCEDNTGGALDLIPFTSSTEGALQSACLVYCANGVDKLTFQQVALQPGAVVCSDEASTFLLKGPVQQINSSSTCGHSCVAVRSPYHCGVWSVSSSQQPHLLQALSFEERVSCVSVSPRVVGEVLVASESGAAHLWKLGSGVQLVRTEDSNLYFNSQSSWRWSEFSAHPRVMLYADRTGVELTDIREQPSSCHTLFRISKAAECRSGERLLLCRYLSPVHSFHHLVTTQYSAYIMDERFSCVPMLKWDHMMDSPPVFCHVLPGSGTSTGGTAKVLLGSQRAQEVTLLQYSGGGSEACVSRGPPQTLLRPRDSVDLLPPQIPHRTEGSRGRLTYPATGLTAVHLKRSPSEGSFCVLQLLQTGDVFYQILEKASSPTEPSTERPTSRQAELHLSQESTSIWKQWLQKLSRSNEANKCSDVTVKSRLHLSKRQTQDVRTRRKTQRDLQKCMCARELYVGAAEEVEPLRVDVRAEDWSDEVSSRLTAGWDGEEAWQSWWAGRLGFNAAEKTREMRMKRRREKDARRASGITLLSMSGSFTSSVSYQSELSDLSDWAWSDTGGDPPTQDTPEKQRLNPSSAGTEESVRLRSSSAGTEESVRLRSSSAGTEESVRLRSPSAGTEESVRLRSLSAVTPETVRPRSRVETPASERRAAHIRPGVSQTRDPYSTPSSSLLSSSLPSSLPSATPKILTSSLDSFSWSQSSQRPSQFSQRPSRSSPRPSRSSQRQSLSSLPSATPKPLTFSQDAFSWSQSSQRPSQSSQSSQPRKKSRMGF